MSSVTPGRETDARIAEKLGWSDFFTSPHNGERLGLPPSAYRPRSGNGAYHKRLMDYSTSPADALAAVAEVQRKHPGWRFCLLGGDRAMGYINNSPSLGVDESSRRNFFGWQAEFFGDEDPRVCTGERHATGRGDTIPTAICAAILQLPRGEG